MRNFIVSMSSFVVSWKDWWSKLSLFRKVLPLLIAALYIGCLIVLNQLTHKGGLRSDHFVTAGAAMGVWYLGPRCRTVFHFLLPLFLVGIVYDSMRYYSDLIRGPIHVAEPYLFDRFFFGINTSEGRLIPNEWFQKHTHPALDVITGFFYILFIPIYALISAYFCFWIAPQRNIGERFRPMWAFFWLNVLGYSTYYWYAAAPPWYVALYGTGPADLSVIASPAGAARFDAFFGIPYFAGMYGRAADVFGAVPSLHVAYPLQAVFYSLRYNSLTAFSVFFYLGMCFSAVYLNHHYILDILWGSVYALLVCFALEYSSLVKTSPSSSKSVFCAW